MKTHEALFKGRAFFFLMKMLEKVSKNKLHLKEVRLNDR